MGEETVQVGLDHNSLASLIRKSVLRWYVWIVIRGILDIATKRESQKQII